MRIKQATSVIDLCANCAYCKSAIRCPGELFCVACGACIDACPQRARIFIETEREIEKYNLLIDGEIFTVLENQTVMQVLESLGY